MQPTKGTNIPRLKTKTQCECVYPVCITLIPPYQALGYCLFTFLCLVWSPPCHSSGRYPRSRFVVLESSHPLYIRQWLKIKSFLRTGRVGYFIQAHRPGTKGKIPLPCEVSLPIGLLHKGVFLPLPPKIYPLANCKHNLVICLPCQTICCQAIRGVSIKRGAFTIAVACKTACQKWFR